MTDQYLPGPDQHDTAAFARPLPPAGPTRTADPYEGQPAGYPYTTASPHQWVPGPVAPAASNPEADYWAARYRSQRTWTRVLAAVGLLATLGLVATGFAAWQFARTNPLVAAATDLADGLGQVPALPEGTFPEDTAPEGTTPEGTTPEGTTPEDTTPEGTTPDAPAPQSGDLPLSELPLPDSLKSLAATLGITDVGQLLDMAVANGLMTQEDADRIRAGLAAGSALQGLTGEQE
jgi:hypothetical protein